MKYLVVILIILLPLLSTAQTSQTKELTIGDSIQNIPYIPIINHTDTTATLSNFTNELIIIDFWATWCAPCVKALPHLQELQKQFGNQLRFLLTTPQDKSTIKEFLQKKQITLSCFVEDRILSEYFPHDEVPHEVWIHKGKIIAITYAEEVTAANIQRVLDGKTVNFVLKKDNLKYNSYEPLLVDGNGGVGNDLVYHSVLTGYLDGIGGGGILTDSLNRFKIRAFNHSVVDLFRFAAERIDKVFSTSNRILIEADKKKIDPTEDPRYTPSVRGYFYCYELIIPASSNINAADFMIEDLNRYFGMLYQIKGEIEVRNVLCWVLRKSDKPMTILTKSAKPYMSSDDGYSVWLNKPFSSFFTALAYIYRDQPHPFIDKTDINGNVDVKFPYEPKDMAALQSLLKNMGLKLTLEEAEIPMLVIKNISE